VTVSNGQSGPNGLIGAIEQIDAFKHHFEAADWIPVNRVAAGTTTA
jgi:hypothetical protein